MSEKLTEGNIGKSLVLFSLPMILGNLLQQLYQIADTLIVGKTIGAAALSAVGSSYALMTLLTSVVLGLCMGSGVVFAQLYGAKKMEEMKISICNAFFFVLAVSVLIGSLSFLLLELIMAWLNIPAEALALTRQYLAVVIVGIPLAAVYHFFAAVLRSVGNTVAPLIFLAVSAVVNVVLDFVFILSFQLGVAGAAWATVLAQMFSMLCIVFYFWKKEKWLRPQKRHFVYHKKLLYAVISQSALTAIQQSIMNFGILMVQGLVNSFGFAASAAFAVVVKIDAFAYMPAQDFGNAFSTFIAQNYGAKKPERMQKGLRLALLFSFCFCLLASACVCLFAKPLMLLFVEAAETEILAIGMQYLYIEGAFYAGIGILFLLYGFYRGIGRPAMSIVLTVISLGSRVLLAYLLSAVPAIGLPGVWWAIPIGWGFADFVGIGYYWLQKKRADQTI